MPTQVGDRDDRSADHAVAGAADRVRGLLVDERLPDVERRVEHEPHGEVLLVAAADVADGVARLGDAGPERPELVALAGGEGLLGALVRLEADDVVAVPELLLEEVHDGRELDDLERLLVHGNTCFVLNTRERRIHCTPPETGLR